jgi:hypothetical protein
MTMVMTMIIVASGPDVKMSLAGAKGPPTRRGRGLEASSLPLPLPLTLPLPLCQRSGKACRGTGLPGRSAWTAGRPGVAPPARSLVANRGSCDRAGDASGGLHRRFGTCSGARLPGVPGWAL